MINDWRMYWLSNFWEITFCLINGKYSSPVVVYFHPTGWSIWLFSFFQSNPLIVTFDLPVGCYNYFDFFTLLCHHKWSMWFNYLSESLILVLGYSSLLFIYQWYHFKLFFILIVFHKLIRPPYPLISVTCHLPFRGQGLQLLVD